MVLTDSIWIPSHGRCCTMDHKAFLHLENHEWQSELWPFLLDQTMTIHTFGGNYSGTDCWMTPTGHLYTHRRCSTMNHRALPLGISQILDATTATRMKIGKYCQQQRCKHVELEQFLACFRVARVCQRQLGFLVHINTENLQICRFHWTSKILKAFCSQSHNKGLSLPKGPRFALSIGVLTTGPRGPCPLPLLTTKNLAYKSVLAKMQPYRSCPNGNHRNCS